MGTRNDNLLILTDTQAEIALGTLHTSYLTGMAQKLRTTSVTATAIATSVAAMLDNGTTTPLAGSTLMDICHPLIIMYTRAEIARGTPAVYILTGAVPKRRMITPTAIVTAISPSATLSNGITKIGAGLIHMVIMEITKTQDLLLALRMFTQAEIAPGTLTVYILTGMAPKLRTTTVTAIATAISLAAT